jgi:hypothetical protein
VSFGHQTFVQQKFDLDTFGQQTFRLTFGQPSFSQQVSYNNESLLTKCQSAKWFSAKGRLTTQSLEGLWFVPPTTQKIICASFFNENARKLFPRFLNFRPNSLKTIHYNETWKAVLNAKNVLNINAIEFFYSSATSFNLLTITLNVT